MKKLGILFTCAIIVLFLISEASSSPRKRLDEASKVCRIFTQTTLWDGYKTFQNSCKNCHFTGNDQGAPFLHTESKTMKGWNRVFGTRYPECAQKGYWGAIEQEQLMRLNDYLFVKAANSYNPYDAADCG
jgi:hypothetical protein